MLFLDMRKFDGKSILFLEENGFILNHPPYTGIFKVGHRGIEHYMKNHKTKNGIDIPYYFNFDSETYSYGIPANYFNNQNTNGNYFVVFSISNVNELKIIVENIENTIEVIFSINFTLKITNFTLKITNSKKSKIKLYGSDIFNSKPIPVVSVLK